MSPKLGCDICNEELKDKPVTKTVCATCRKKLRKDKKMLKKKPVAL